MTLLTGPLKVLADITLILCMVDNNIIRSWAWDDRPGIEYRRT